MKIVISLAAMLRHPRAKRVPMPACGVRGGAGQGQGQCGFERPAGWEPPGEAAIRTVCQKQLAMSRYSVAWTPAHKAPSTATLKYALYVHVHSTRVEAGPPHTPFPHPPLPPPSHNGQAVYERVAPAVSAVVELQEAAVVAARPRAQPAAAAAGAAAGAARDGAWAGNLSTIVPPLIGALVHHPASNCW